MSNHRYSITRIRFSVPERVELDAFDGVVPPGIDTDSKMMRSLAAVLKFPPYFGENWNAVDECLRNMEWIEQHRIRIIHKDVPMRANAADVSLYVRVLLDAQQSLDRGLIGHKELEIYFPSESRALIEQIINQLT